MIPQILSSERTCLHSQPYGNVGVYKHAREGREDFGAGHSPEVEE